MRAHNKLATGLTRINKPDQPKLVIFGGPYAWVLARSYKPRIA